MTDLNYYLQIYNTYLRFEFVCLCVCVQKKFIIIINQLLFPNQSTESMQKQQQIQAQQTTNQQNNDLNQFGRPKQKVIFYELTQDMKRQALEKLEKDKMVQSQQMYEKAKNETQKVWDKFYKFHKCSFFKDRTYLERQIQPITFFKNQHNETGKVSEFVELGCGVGNTLFPLLREYPCFNYFGFDISAKAISLIQQQMQKHLELQDRMKVTVCDLVKNQIPFKGHGDLSTLIFVLSAIVPQKHLEVAQKIADWMKPGSFLYFRDYGRYDFGQLNLSSKGNRKIRDNFYMKNDGVCVYYFQKEEVQKMFEKVGLVKIKSNNLCKLLQNRKRDLKMYRVWLQCLFYKPPLSEYLEQQVKGLDKEQNVQIEIENREQQQEKKEQAQEIKQDTNNYNGQGKQEQKQEHKVENQPNRQKNVEVDQK